MKEPIFTANAGRIKIITIVATAGNVTTDVAVPANKRWKVLNIRIVLTTDATVANRYITIEEFNGTNTIGEIASSVGVTASLTREINARSFLDYVGGALISAGMSSFGLWILEGGEIIRIIISNGLAGDSYIGFVKVLEVDV